MTRDQLAKQLTKLCADYKTMLSYDANPREVTAFIAYVVTTNLPMILEALRRMD